MSEYQTELAEAATQAREAYDAISEWLDRPISGSEPIPTAELEKRVKQLRGARERLFTLQEEHGKLPDIVAAIEANTALFRNIGVTLPEEL